MAIQTFHLSPADKKYLENLLRRGKLPVKTFKRATGLLELNRGRPVSEVASTLGLSLRTVTYWRQHYTTRGLGMLVDLPRSGRPITIDGSQRASITALACSQPPDGHSRWSLRLLADRAVELNIVADISHNHVGQILKKTNSNRT